MKFESVVTRTFACSADSSDSSGARALVRRDHRTD